ncbi:hydrogenase maturation protein [Nitrosomonas sp.]|uniref:hydrogenase maturation protein n=1 Tax=Nitrosomonas sp. TaxID=42353 RepID=UPI0020835BD3|nr:hydrogenase maturation protein [Nitrosomonas sp.]GJL74321.1 MAG: hydrogenase maturation factor HoxX [Nitrosomonas sp.]
MKILFLTHSFNSLTQRLFVELTRRNHDIAIEFDINDAVSIEAVELFQPELIIAPFLKRAIPETIWRRIPCFVVHPGIVGDRGPSALDWAIMYEKKQWGVTVLQANAQMDAGDIWATENFSMPPVHPTKKSSLYRHQVVEAAVCAVLTAVERFTAGNYAPQPLDYLDPEVHGRLHPPIRQTDRAIDWQCDNTHTVLKKICAADGFPGVLDTIYDASWYLFDAYPEAHLTGEPGNIIAKRNNAICRATTDGAVWIGHLKRKFEKMENDSSFKIAATLALRQLPGNALDSVPEVCYDFFVPGSYNTYRDIWFEQKNAVGYLHFAFYNGAMDTGQCERLRQAYLQAAKQNVKVIVLMGGPDFWSNGIHLNHIEQAASPADESWRNINAMNDLVQTIITNERQLTVAALQGNAGAGGVFLSLAADYIYARESVILNPHYKSMGNLYGSEYWTYLLPRRISRDKTVSLSQNRLPIGAQEAVDMGLIDACFAQDRQVFIEQIERRAEQFAHAPDYPVRLQQKVQRRRCDEQQKPLQNYRKEELHHMELNFYGFDPSYHVARYHFVHKLPHAWTPLYLAKHRRSTY